MMEQLIEKRRASRRKEETLVRFEGDNFLIYSRATDLSDSGAFLATYYLLDPGTRIQLALIDPSGAEESHSARVVRTMTRTDDRGGKAIGLGVEFLA